VAKIITRVAFQHELAARNDFLVGRRSYDPTMLQFLGILFMILLVHLLGFLDGALAELLLESVVLQLANCLEVGRCWNFQRIIMIFLGHGGFRCCLER